MLVGLLAACGGGGGTNEATPPPADGGTPAITTTPEPAPEGATFQSHIRIAQPSDLPSNTPYGEHATQTAVLTNSTFSRLVDVDTSDFSILPALATTWESNEDSTVWTFHLRDDVQFHNGEHFTANDVKFTFEYAGSADNEGIMAAIVGAAYIDEIVVEDDYTITFYLNRSTADWLIYASQKIMSQASVERYGIDVGGSIGTGPFRFESHNPGVSWTIVRFDDYWGELPVTEQITSVVIPDAAARSLALEAGDVEAVFAPAITDIPRFLHNDDINVFRAESISTIFLAINTGRPAGEDMRVRQAIAMAVNRNDIALAAFEGGEMGVPGYNFINSVTMGHAPVDAFSLDLDAARALLSEAGYDANNRLQLELYTFALMLPIAEIIQHSLAQVDIDVHITEWAQSGFSANIREDGGFDLYVQQSSQSGGVLNIIQRFITADGDANLMQYNSPELEALFQSALDAASWDEMMYYYALIQQHIAYEVPLVPLIQQYLWVLGASNVGGINLSNQPNFVDFSNVFAVEQ